LKVYASTNILSYDLFNLAVLGLAAIQASSTTKDAVISRKYIQCISASIPYVAALCASEAKSTPSSGETVRAGLNQECKSSSKSIIRKPPPLVRIEDAFAKQRCEHGRIRIGNVSF